MIVIIGEGASGKDTLADALILKDPKYRKLVMFTTRPARDDEKDGEDYHFVRDIAFEELSKRDFFIEENTYNDWHYGTPRCEVEGNTENLVAVMTPAGMRRLRMNGVKFTSVYLRVDRRSRLIQMIERGDNIEEAYRRNVSDLGQFDGIEDEVDYIIDNPGYKMNVKNALTCLLAIIDTERKKEEENERGQEESNPE